jgi:hypothetical protein
MSLEPIGADAVFGTFTELSREQQDRVKNYLRQAWRAQFDVEPGLFSSDLESLQEIYSPAIQAKKLRDVADGVATVSARRPPIDPVLYVPIDEQRGLVTP